jgi:hypothetical protein
MDSALKRLKIGSDQDLFVVLGRDEVIRLDNPWEFARMIESILKSMDNDPDKSESKFGQNVFQFIVEGNGRKFRAVASIQDSGIIYFDPEAKEGVQHPVPSVLFGNKSYTPYVFANPLRNEPWVITAFITILRHPSFEKWSLVNLINYVASLSKKYKSVGLSIDGTTQRTNRYAEMHRKRRKEVFKNLLLIAAATGMPYTSIAVDDSTGKLVQQYKTPLPELPPQMVDKIIRDIDPLKDLQTQKRREFRTISSGVAMMVPPVKRGGTYVIDMSQPITKSSLPDVVQAIQQAYRLRIIEVALDDDSDPLPVFLHNVKRLSHPAVQKAAGTVRCLEVVGDYFAEKSLVLWLAEILGDPDCSIHELNLLQAPNQGSWDVLANVVNSTEYLKVEQTFVTAVARNKSLTHVNLTSLRMCQLPCLRGLAMREDNLLQNFGVDDAEHDSYGSEDTKDRLVLPSDVVPVLRKNWNSLNYIHLVMSDKQGVIASIEGEFQQQHPTASFYFSEMEGWSNDSSDSDDSDD